MWPTAWCAAYAKSRTGYSLMTVAACLSSPFHWWAPDPADSDTDEEK